MVPASLFVRFQKALGTLPIRAADDPRYDKADLIREDFQLFSEDGLDVYYAPFHSFSRDARVVLVGLTPGWTQMEEAFRAARYGLSQGLTGADLFQYIDKHGSYSGPMRKNLVGMLDEIGLATALGLPSCDLLFSAGSWSVNFTSVVSAPIFRNGENYRGVGPTLLGVSKLQDWVTENLGTELASAPKAIVVPLGRCADEAIAFLQSHGIADLPGRYLTGFPHPSGANGHRKTDFARGRDLWTNQIAEWFRLGGEL